MKWSKEQLLLLDEASRKANPAYLRLRALAVWHVAQGKSRTQSAECVNTTRQTVGHWVRQFQKFGIDGLRIQKGRGNKARVDHSDVESYIYRSPYELGINRTRWTLKLLSEHVPSLKGFSDTGVLKVLRRLGIGYKRGQPQLKSPDPEYFEKKSV